MKRFPKGIDYERLAISVILVASVRKPGMTINHARLWHRLHTDPLLVWALCASGEIMALYARLDMSQDRRALLDSGKWE